MKYNLVALMVLSLVLAGCSDTGDDGGGSGSDMVALTINVDENGWQGKTVNVTTRSGETIDGLKAAHANGGGFGIFGISLLYNTQRLVLWNSSTGQWDAGERIYWKRTSDENDNFDVYAYAPYDSAATFPTTNASSGILPFTASDKDGTDTDLLYAHSQVSRTNGLATLTFRHAMAKLSFGTITNNSNDAIELQSLTLTGDLYSGGKLNTNNGMWSGLTNYDPASNDPASKTFTRSDFDSSTSGDQGLTIAGGKVATLDIDPFILIPGPTVTITLTFTGGDTFSFTTTLEQGKDKTYNITVNKNFEVVIAE